MGIRSNPTGLVSVNVARRLPEQIASLPPSLQSVLLGAAISLSGDLAFSKSDYFFYDANGSVPMLTRDGAARAVTEAEARILRSASKGRDALQDATAYRDETVIMRDEIVPKIDPMPQDRPELQRRQLQLKALMLRFSAEGSSWLYGAAMRASWQVEHALKQLRG